MSKVRITEAQVAMIQKRLDDMDKKKVLKINENQYDRLFKGGFNKSSSTMSKNLKKGGIKENEEGLDINPLEFAQELIVFIKDVIANPKRVPFSTYWEGLGITRKELFSLVKKEDLLTMMVDEANVKSYKAKKIGFRKGIKELCKKVMDRQLTEDGGGYPTGAEFDPTAPYNQDDGEYENGDKGIKCKKCPLKYVYFNERSDDLMIFKDANGLYAFNGANTPEEEYADFMDMDGIVDDEAIYHYVNVLLEEGLMKIEVEPEMLGDGKVVKIGPELKELLLSWYGNNDPKLGDILNRLPESTGAGSSGAYVGGMSGGPIKKDTGMSPEEALRNINEDMAINQYLITYNLDDNGGDTSPFFNEFHEVQEFMNKLEKSGVVTGVKVSKTDDKGAVAKEFTYDFDGREWQKRQPVAETTSMGGAGGINVGNGGDSIEHDVNAFGDSNFMKAGNKLNKEEAMPMIKRPGVNEALNDPRNGFKMEGEESLNQEYLQMLHQYQSATSIPEGNMIAQRILDWGKKNGLNIPRSMFPTLDEVQQLQVGQVYTNGHGRAKVEKDLGDGSFQIRRWGDTPANSVNIGGTELSGWTLLEGKKVLKLTESQAKMLTESTDISQLVSLFQQSINKVDESLNYTEFADAVAYIIKDSYGSHLIEPIMERLRLSLPKQDNVLPSLGK